MVNGKQRQANLRALHDRALSYEKSSFRGLFRFLRFIDRMHSRGDDLGIAKSIGEADDVVTLITIHKSKGLEFPVVFVAGMDRNFNTMDLRARYMFDDSFGIAVNAVNTDLNFMTKSLATLYVTDKKKAKMKAEEMRILYVAMTRAKERLILVGSIADFEKTKESWSRFENFSTGNVLPSYVRSKANSYLSWVGPAIAGHEEYPFIMRGLDAVDSQTKKWKIQVISNEAFKQRQLEQDQHLVIQTNEINEGIVNELIRRFETPYTFEQAIVQKSKTSVSEIKRMQALEEMEENPYTHTQRTFFGTPKPSFLQETKKYPLSAAQVGTAVHVVMQHAPVEGLYTIEETNQYFEKLVMKQLLSAEEAEAIDPSKVVAFYHTAIGQRLLKAKTTLKEVPFTLSIPTALGDSQIIQGVIDCMFEEADGKWVLLDYKTDKILPYFAEGPALEKEMRSRYETQLHYYTMAIESIKRVEVKEKILFLYDIGKELELTK